MGVNGKILLMQTWQYKYLSFLWSFASILIVIFGLIDLNSTFESGLYFFALFLLALPAPYFFYKSIKLIQSGQTRFYDVVIVIWSGLYILLALFVADILYEIHRIYSPYLPPKN